MTSTIPVGAQLALTLPHRSLYRPEDFLVGPANQEAWTWLGRMADWPDRRLLVWGEPGCGKTHLLHLWASRVGAEYRSAAMLAGIPAEPGPNGVAIDDADTPAEEAALLHLLNLCREHGVPVLLAARTPPARWSIQLPDLGSRLRAITAVPIPPPDDAFLRALLLRLLADRTLPVAPTLPDWLLRRLPRSPGALRDAVAALDHASLAEHGPVTRALATRALGDALLGLDTGDADADMPSDNESSDLRDDPDPGGSRGALGSVRTDT